MTVAVTEMWDDWDLKAARHRRTFDHPELYDFVDISQNNHNSGEKHWANALWVRQYLANRPRPINTVKTYGATGNKFGHNDQDAVERAWRHVLAGVASARFHRPDSGLGLNEQAQAALRSVRCLETLVKAWELAPMAEGVSGVDGTPVYAAKATSRAGAVVYLPQGGRARVTAAAGPYSLWWIDVDRGSLGRPSPLASETSRCE